MKTYKPHRCLKCKKRIDTCTSDYCDDCHSQNKIPTPSPIARDAAEKVLDKLYGRDLWPKHPEIAQAGKDGIIPIIQSAIDADRRSREIPDLDMSPQINWRKARELYEKFKKEQEGPSNDDQ